MLVEFDTVKSSHKEMHFKELDRKLTGEASVPYTNEKDYLCSITVDMTTVVDFEQGTVYYNESKVECVYARLNSDDVTRNLFVGYDVFKKIFEEVKGIKVKTVNEILKKKL